MSITETRLGSLYTRSTHDGTSGHSRPSSMPTFDYETNRELIGITSRPHSASTLTSFERRSANPMATHLEEAETQDLSRISPPPVFTFSALFCSLQDIEMGDDLDTASTLSIPTPNKWSSDGVKARSRLPAESSPMTLEEDFAGGSIDFQPDGDDVSLDSRTIESATYLSEGSPSLQIAGTVEGDDSALHADAMTDTEDEISRKRSYSCASDDLELASIQDKNVHFDVASGSGGKMKSISRADTPRPGRVLPSLKEGELSAPIVEKPEPYRHSHAECYDPFMKRHAHSPDFNVILFGNRV